MTPATTQPTDAAERRGGAPIGNANRMRHGLRGSGLPAGCGHIRKAVNDFRRQLEDAILEARGEITLVDAANVSTAFRWEKHAQLAQRWLRLEAESMSPADRLAYSRDVARASAERDKAIAALGLPERPNGDDWHTVHAEGNGNG